MRKTALWKCLLVTAIFLSAAPLTAQAAADGQQNAAQNGAADSWVTYEGSRYRVREDGSRYESAWFSVISAGNLPSSKPTALW